MTKIQKIGLVTGGIISTSCALALWSALENMTRDDVNLLSNYIATDYLQYNETWKTIVCRMDRALIIISQLIICNITKLGKRLCAEWIGLLLKAVAILQPLAPESLVGYFSKE